MDFTKKKIFTIPNIISFFRLLLIPVIVYSYVFLDNNILALGLIILSGLTDVIDGKIARKFNMVSDLGKILDPVADKLTQIAVIACLVFKYKIMLLVVIILTIKEIALAITGLLTISSAKKVYSAEWHGKLCTVIIYSTMFLLLLIPNLPYLLVKTLAFICIVMMIISTCLYLRERYQIIKNAKGMKNID